MSLARAVQVAPRSVVTRIVPEFPTATAVSGPSTANAMRWFPVGSGFCHDQPEAPTVPPVKPTNAMDRNHLRLLPDLMRATPPGPRCGMYIGAPKDNLLQVLNVSCLTEL